MSCLRLARGFTERDKIIKFAGCYHGHADSLLVKAGSGALTHGQPDSAGVPKAIADETIVLPFNNIDAVRMAFRENKDSPHLNLAGIHLHIGSQNPSAAAYAEALEVLFSNLREIAAETGLKLSHMNLGGGFPVNYLSEHSLDQRPLRSVDPAARRGKARDLTLLCPDCLIRTVLACSHAVHVRHCRPRHAVV